MKKLKVKNHIAKLKHNVRSVEKFISAITHSAKTTEALEDHSEEMVTLWTENKYSRTVPRKIILSIEEKITIQPGNHVHTKCPSIVTLDNLLEYFQTSELPDDCRFWELLLIAEYYDIPDLITLVSSWAEKLFAWKASNTHIADVEYAYFSIPHTLMTKFYPQVEKLLLVIHQSFPTAVPFLTADGERTTIELLTVKRYFPKLILLRPLEFPNGELKWPPKSIPCDLGSLHIIFKYKNGHVDLKDIEPQQLASITGISCLLGYRKLFRESFMILYHVTEVVADDVLNLMYDIRVVDDYKDYDDYELFEELETYEEHEYAEYMNALSEITPYIEEPLWRNGSLIPLRIRDWMSEWSDEDNEDESHAFIFVPRSILLERLSTYLARHPLELLVYGFLFDSPYAQSIKKFFGKESLRFETDVDLLEYMLALSSNFEYEQMYCEAYAALLRLDENWRTTIPLHGHCYSRKEFVDLESNGNSGLVTLVAEDGARGKIQRNKLIESSIFFENFFKIFPDSNEIFCTYCTDAVVLSIWIAFMIKKTDLRYALQSTGHISAINYFSLSQQRGDEFSSLPKVDWEDIQRTFINVNRLADYYMVPGLLAFNMELYIDPVYHFHHTYNSIPIENFLTDEDKEMCLSRRKDIETRHFDQLVDTPHFLEMEVSEFILVLLNVKSNVDVCYRALKVYVELNSDDLKGSRFINPKVFSSSKRSSRLLIIREAIDKAILYFKDAYPVLTEIKEALNLKKLIDASVGSTEHIGTSFVLSISELTVAHNLEAFYIYNDDHSYEKIKIHGRPPHTKGIHVFQNMLMLIKDDIIEFRNLPANTSNITQPEISIVDTLSILEWNGELIAIFPHCCKVYRPSEASWEVLSIQDYGYPLEGSCRVVGDRLYFFPHNGDWVRYIVASANDKEEQDFAYETYFIEPSKNNDQIFKLGRKEPICRFHDDFDDHTYCHYCSDTNRFNCRNIVLSGFICPPGVTKHAFLFVQSHVLIINKDSLEIVERRSWPSLPLTEDFVEAIFTDKALSVLYANGNRFTVYQLRFQDWQFEIALSGPLKSHPRYTFFNMYGPVRYFNSMVNHTIPETPFSSMDVNEDEARDFYYS